MEEKTSALVVGPSADRAGITVEDARHALWHAGDYGLGAVPGTFTALLIRAFDHADLSNRQKLWHGWPGLSSALVLTRTEVGLDWLRDLVKGADR